MIAFFPFPFWIKLDLKKKNYIKFGYYNPGNRLNFYFANE